MHKSIKAKHTQARRDKDRLLALMLGNLLDDLGNEAKKLKIDFVEDKVTISVVNKWIKRMDNLMETYKDTNKEAYDNAREEKDVYSSLLPQQLDEKEIIDILTEHQLDTIPKAMEYFSKVYLGRYNSKEVIRILNSLKN